MSALAAPGSMKEQIKFLLKANCRPGDVAAQVGCDPSYISQLMQDDQFVNEVLTARVQYLEKSAQRDLNYDEIEDQLISGLKSKVEQGVTFWKPDILLRAITTINNAKRRSVQLKPEGGDTIINNNIIQLTVPAHAVKQFQVNSDNEVIAVGAQELVSMPAKQLLNMVKSAITVQVEEKEMMDKEMQKIKRNGKYQPVARQIPDKEMNYEYLATAEETRIAQRIASKTIGAGQI